MRANTHDPSSPDRCQQFVLTDNAVAVPHQINQEVEDLGLERDLLGAAPELAPVNVESVIAKGKFHLGSPRPAFLKEFSGPPQW
jgi:hypothetical protein